MVGSSASYHDMLLITLAIKVFLECLIRRTAITLMRFLQMAGLMGVTSVAY